MHKKRNRILLVAGLGIVVGAVLGFGGCSAIMEHASARQVPFSYFGQIAVGAPMGEHRNYIVPLSFSGGNYAMNSGVVPYRIETHVLDSEIEMTVVIALAGKGSLSKYQIVLSDVSPGDYTVVYRDPDGTRHKVSPVVIPNPATSSSAAFWEQVRSGELRSFVLHGFAVDQRPGSFWPVVANIFVPAARLEEAKQADAQFQPLIASRLAGLHKDDIEQRDRCARLENEVLTDIKGRLPELSVQAVFLSLDIK